VIINANNYCFIIRVLNFLKNHKIMKNGTVQLVGGLIEEIFYLSLLRKSTVKKS